MRGADLLGEVEPALVQVDRDDLRCAVERGGRHHGQAHRARADHGDRVARLDPAVLDADLEPGRQDVREQDGGRVRHALGQPIQRGVGERDPDLLGLSAVDHVAKDPADTDRTLVGEAVRRVPAAAVAAHPARADARDDHAVARLDGVDRRAHLQDGAHAFVPEDPARGHLRGVSLEDVQVRPADGGRGDLDDSVGRFDQMGVRDVVPALLARPVVDECLHGSSWTKSRRTSVSPCALSICRPWRIAGDEGPSRAARESSGSPQHARHPRTPGPGVSHCVARLRRAGGPTPRRPCAPGSSWSCPGCRPARPRRSRRSRRTPPGRWPAASGRPARPSRPCSRR